MIIYDADDPRHFIRCSPFAVIQLTRGKEQKKVVKDWERKYTEISTTNGFFKKITKITDDNADKFSRISDQKLQFMFDNFMPEKVIICRDQGSIETVEQDVLDSTNNSLNLLSL